MHLDIYIPLLMLSTIKSINTLLEQECCIQSSSYYLLFLSNNNEPLGCILFFYEPGVCGRSKEQPPDEAVDDASIHKEVPAGAQGGAHHYPQHQDQDQGDQNHGDLHWQSRCEPIQTILP